MKLTHEEKIKLAAEMRTSDERSFGISIFQSKAWEKRSKDITQRLKNQKEKALKRREEKEKNT